MFDLILTVSLGRNRFGVSGMVQKGHGYARYSQIPCKMEVCDPSPHISCRIQGQS
jgi:hypothetical protein